MFPMKKAVSSTTTGATRPDVVVKNADGSIKAIEVKNYNLASSNSRYYLNEKPNPPAMLGRME